MTYCHELELMVTCTIHREVVLTLYKDYADTSAQSPRTFTFTITQGDFITTTPDIAKYWVSSNFRAMYHIDTHTFRSFCLEARYEKCRAFSRGLT